MKKNILIFAAAILLVVLIAGGIFFLLQKKGPSPSPGASFPSSPAEKPSSASFTQVQTAQGGTLQTRDFLSDPVTAPDPVNTGYYNLGYQPKGDQGYGDAPYSIEYIASTQYFNISLLKEPLGENRKTAEQFLMQHLGISEQQMCQLNYTMSVPSWVNDTYAGENLGFSFCPGAVALP